MDPFTSPGSSRMLRELYWISGAARTLLFTVHRGLACAVIEAASDSEMPLRKIPTMEIFLRRLSAEGAFSPVATTSNERRGRFVSASTVRQLSAKQLASAIKRYSTGEMSSNVAGIVWVTGRPSQNRVRGSCPFETTLTAHLLVRCEVMSAHFWVRRAGLPITIPQDTEASRTTWF